MTIVNPYHYHYGQLIKFDLFYYIAYDEPFLPEKIQLPTNGVGPSAYKHKKVVVGPPNTDIADKGGGLVCLKLDTK